VASSLAKIGQRGGKELQAMLEGMGEEGYALVNALAGASTSSSRASCPSWRRPASSPRPRSRTSPSSSGRQHQGVQQFAADLQKLARSGFGDLAQALAAQGDSSAMALAHQAVGQQRAGGSGEQGRRHRAEHADRRGPANSSDPAVDLAGRPGRGFADLIAAGLDVATIKASCRR
jgi:hypothetical protein